MFYNFAAWVESKFPTETIFRNSRILIAPATIIPIRNAVIIETGGIEQPWFTYGWITVQIIVRDQDQPKARKFAYDIFEEITNHFFGEVFPAETVDGVTYPAIQCAQMSALQKPGNMGADGSGNFEYSTNYKLIFKRK
jgi:hypothetical protein